MLTEDQALKKGLGHIFEGYGGFLLFALPVKFYYRSFIAQKAWPTSLKYK